MAANIYQAVKQAMQDLIAPQLESLKGEIGELRGEVRGEMQAVRGEIGELRGEMRGEMQAVRGEIGELRAEMRGEIRSVRGELGELRGEVRGDIATLRAETQAGIATLAADVRRVDEKLTWALDLRERIVALETKLAVERP